MDARITDGVDFFLVGLSFFGDPFSGNAGWTEENEIGRLWSRFMRYRNEAGGDFPPVSPIPLPGYSGASESLMFEAHIFDSDTVKTGHYEVFVGYPTDLKSGVVRIPTLLSVKHFVSAKTAWFSLSGTAMADEDSYKAMENWIAERGFVRDGSGTCNVYDERFKGLDRLDESVIDVFIPVR